MARQTRGKTLTIDTEIRIAAAAAHVMHVLTDFASYPRWNPYLVRIDGMAATGAQIIVHADIPGRPDPLIQTVDIVHVDRLEMRWAGGLPDRGRFAGDHWFVLQPASGHTEFRHFEHFSGSLAPNILADHGDTIRDNFVRFNEALKQRAEACL